MLKGVRNQPGNFESGMRFSLNFLKSAVQAITVSLWFNSCRAMREEVDWLFKLRATAVQKSPCTQTPSAGSNLQAWSKESVFSKDPCTHVIDTLAFMGLLFHDFRVYVLAIPILGPFGVLRIQALQDAVVAVVA